VSATSSRHRGYVSWQPVRQRRPPTYSSRTEHRPDPCVRPADLLDCTAKRATTPIYRENNESSRDIRDVRSTNCCMSALWREIWVSMQGRFSLVPHIQLWLQIQKWKILKAFRKRQYRWVYTKFWLLGRPSGVTGGLKNASDVSFFRTPFSEFPRPITLKLCHLIGICVYFIMQVQKLGGGHSPEKISGPKHAKFRSILDHFRLWSRLSLERLKISKIGRRYKLWQFLLRLMKKVRWTLVH